MLSLSVVLELLAFLFALAWCRQKGYILFIPFLLYTVLNEIVAYYIGYVLHIKNYFLYTIYIPISFVFYAYLIFKSISNERTRLFFKITSSICLLFAIVNALFIQGFNSFNTFTNTTVSIVLITFCLLFLFDFLRTSEATSNPLNEAMFWIVAGLLFFYFGGIILNVLYKYAVDQNFQINGRKMYSFVFQFLNFLLYGCFIIAFRICYKKRKFIS
jgi:hypothetical protein